MAETHATLSPSSADRWMTCPGSVPLSEDIVDTKAEDPSLSVHLPTNLLHSEPSSR